MLCIIFYLNLRLKYVVKYLFLFFCKYLWVPVVLKNYAGTRITNMGTGTRQIFIQRVGYGGATISA